MASAPPFTPTDTAHELEIVLRSRIPLIVVESRDELRLLEILKPLASRLARPQVMPIYKWTVTEGLERIDVDYGGPQHMNAPPQEVLKHIRAIDKPGVFVLLDFHPYLDEPANVRMIKDICQGYERVARTLMLLSYQVKLPAELEHFSAYFEVAVPGREERRAIVESVATEWRTANRNGKVAADPKALELIVENLAGLNTSDTRRLVRKVIFDDGLLTKADLPALMEAKYRILNRSGAVTLEHDSAAFADVGGLTRLKDWLEDRRAAFEGSAPDLDAPKGILLLGVQGCGKSLVARAAAGAYRVPLLRLDFGALYTKWHGESERNLRDTLAAADAMAPCVLWLDEIEKGVAAGEGDSGTSKRVLGTLLTWLADKKSRVFVVATANDIAALPPELVRKGRFDEIFFVDLPSAEARARILKLHADKRGLRLKGEAIEQLAAECEGFSGAEIEQAVVAALYLAHARRENACARHIAEELSATRPLSLVMAEQVSALRAWASSRAVPAD
jgi:SpoVK/Ycf46/Vps4 family AAA+-type ATPase